MISQLLLVHRAVSRCALSIRLHGTQAKHAMKLTTRLGNVTKQMKMRLNNSSTVVQSIRSVLVKKQLTAKFAVHVFISSRGATTSPVRPLYFHMAHQRFRNSLRTPDILGSQVFSGVLDV